MISPKEDPLTAARREFCEETGMTPQGEARPLGTYRISSGKTLQAWAVEGGFDIEPEIRVLQSAHGRQL